MVCRDYEKMEMNLNAHGETVGSWWSCGFFWTEPLEHTQARQAPFSLVDSISYESNQKNRDSDSE